MLVKIAYEVPIFGKLSSIFECEELRFKSFYISLLIWGRSSIWLERQIVDLKVEGSSPFDPAKNIVS